jgi:hypothetical protein
MALIYVSRQLEVAKPLTQELGVTNFSFDHTPQIFVIPTDHPILAD